MSTAIREWVRTRLRTRRYDMTSPLAAADVLERLRGRLQPIPRSPFWHPQGKVAYLGRVTGSTFRMYPRGLGRNSWRWVYAGSVVDDGDRSRLTGVLGPARALLVFSAVWTGLVLVFIGIGLVGVIRGLVTGGAVIGALAFSFGALAMLGFFVVMSNTGRKKAAGEWESMTDWLRTAVRASPVESAPAADDG